WLDETDDLFREAGRGCDLRPQHDEDLDQFAMQPVGFADGGYFGYGAVRGEERLDLGNAFGRAHTDVATLRLAAAKEDITLRIDGGAVASQIKARPMAEAVGGGGAVAVVAGEPIEFGFLDIDRDLAFLARRRQASRGIEEHNA